MDDSNKDNDNHDNAETIEEEEEREDFGAGIGFHNNNININNNLPPPEGMGAAGISSIGSIVPPRDTSSNHNHNHNYENPFGTGIGINAADLGLGVGIGIGIGVGIGVGIGHGRGHGIDMEFHPEPPRPPPRPPQQPPQAGNNNNNNNNAGLGQGLLGFDQIPVDATTRNRNYNYNYNQIPEGGIGHAFLTSHFQPTTAAATTSTTTTTSTMTTTAKAGMQLETEDERRCAMEIKQAVQASASTNSSHDSHDNHTTSTTTSTTSTDLEPLTPLSPLTDMEYAQHALVAQGNVFRAMQRIHGMQHFKKLYQIDDTVQQGCQAVQAFLEQQPAFILDVDWNSYNQEPSLVMDMRAFQPARAFEYTRSNKSWNVLVRGHYYLNKACQPTLASIRKGLLVLLDCDGMEWDTNVNTELDLQLYAELGEHYPRKFKKIKAYNTATAANMWFGLLKRTHTNTIIERVYNNDHHHHHHHNHHLHDLPGRPQQQQHEEDYSFYSATQLGCKLVDVDANRAPRRLTETYLPDSKNMKNLEKLERKIVTRVQELLELRDANEREFFLPTTPIAPAVAVAAATAIAAATAATTVRGREVALPFGGHPFPIAPLGGLQQQQQPEQGFQNHFG